MTPPISRRTFLQATSATAGVLLIGIRSDATDDNTAQTLAGWLRIDADGLPTLLVNATEMGQGAHSGLAQILAEEFELDWSQVRIDFSPVEKPYYGVWETYQTGGSGSIRGMFERLRMAGATARELLRAAAAQQWKVAIDECVARSGQIVHTRSGKTAPYGELAAAAARLTPPENVAPKPREQWRLIGKPLPRLDQRRKVDGTAVFGIDVRRPGMLCATLAQCPALSGKLKSVDPAPALKSPNVHRVVTLDNAVAVVAKDFWSALKGLRTLQPVWSTEKIDGFSSGEISRRLTALTSAEGTAFLREGEQEQEVRSRCAAGFAQATKVVEGHYEAPLLSHSPLEPMNGTAHVHGGRAELWLPTQVQSETRTVVAKALGFAESAVTVTRTRFAPSSKAVSCLR